MIFDASLINMTPVQASAMANAEALIPCRALSQVTHRLRSIFRPLCRNGVIHIRRFLQNTTFRFEHATALLRITSLVPLDRLQMVRSIEVECRRLRQAYSGGLSVSHFPRRQQLEALVRYPNLTLLRICLGPLDDGDGYGYRRWMGQHRTARSCRYYQAMHHVRQYLPNLPDEVLLEVFIDTHAGWDGPECWREARALIRLRYQQAAPQDWTLIESVEDEENVKWMSEAQDSRARERLP